MAHLRRPLIALTLLAACAAASAQAADPQKLALAQRVLALWKPETAIVARIQEPAAEAIQQSGIVIQGRVTAEARAKFMKDVEVDAQKYVATVTPIATAAAQKESPAVLVPMLTQQFTVEELKQLVAMLESPVREKFDRLSPKMQETLGEKVTADIKPQLDPAIHAMTESIGVKLRATAPLGPGH